MKRLRSFWFWLAIILPVSTFADSLNDAFDEAIHFGKYKNTGMFSNIDDQAISDKLPYYGVSPIESDLFQSGQGQLTQPGIDKVSNCAGYTPSGNAVLDQECDAVNFIAGHPQMMQHIPIAPNDPILKNTINARSNAPAVFQSTGITAHADGQCTVQIKTIPSIETARSCVNVKEIDPQACLAPRNIVLAQNPHPVTGEITYTVIASDYDLRACDHLETDPAYQYLGGECASTVPPFPLPSGISIRDVAPDGCFVMRHGYAGLTGVEDRSECELFETDPACTFQRDGACLQSLKLEGYPQPICVEQEKHYRCTTAASVENTVLNCAGRKFCINGNCFDTGHEHDTDFVQAMSWVEAAREAGVYLNENTLRLFDGDVGKCRVKLGGVMNCCKPSAGGSAFNNNLLFNISVQAGKNVLAYGSKYMYDALYASSAPDWMVKGMSALYGVDPLKVPASGLLSAWSPSLSYFGFTVSLGEIAPGFVSNLTGIGVAQTNLFGSGLYVGFDPGSLAISIAIMVVQELLSCESDEQILAMKKGENLCQRVGTYCSRRFFGVCLERKRSYCCYNSRLGRLINAQGRAQIGKGWGSARNPSCSGFTQAEFASIDFAALDLSEFAREVMAAVKLPNASDLSSNAQDVITRRIQSYYDTGNQIE